MLKEEIKINNIDEELLASIYKSIEVFDVIKNTLLKIDNKRMNEEDKKYLSLFLGIYLSKNEASKILRLLRYDYEIEVYTSNIDEEVYEKLYKDNFKYLVESMISDSNNTLEDFMIKLLDVEIIKNIHHYKGFSIIPIKLLLNKSLESKKEENNKTLQKI